MKQIRKKQAETGKADIGDTERADFPLTPGKHIDNVCKGGKFEFDSNSTIVLLDRTETNRFEFVAVSWPPGNRGAMVAHKDKEQTFFILKGKGLVTIGDETDTVKPGDIVFVPRNTLHTTEAGDEELTYLCLNSLERG